MKNRRFFITLALIFSIITLFGFSCGGDDDNNSGDDKKASFDGTIDGESTSNEQEEASEGQFGAQIADKVIQIYLIPSASTVIHITGQTSESATLPGNLTINELTYTDSATTIYTYKSGTVNLDKCPGAVGDVFTGKLDVVVENALDSTTKTIKASFSVTVYNVASPNLNCGSNNSGDSTCGYSAEKCEGGVCCPFVECNNACFIKDCMSTCEDANQMMECMSCITNCANVECAEHMTTECQTAYDNLSNCMDTNGCEDLIEDEGVECSRTHCCSELEAAFKE